MNSNVFLIENHDEALDVWRKKKLQYLDLIHIDAHIDLGRQKAEPIQKIFNQARTPKELKNKLEYSLTYTHYQKDFSRQTHIGNYIYPAIEEGIVRNFYWVVPGRVGDFKKAGKFIEGVLKVLSRMDMGQRRKPDLNTQALKKGIVSTNLLGRKFIICVLEKLPILNQKVLLDIDTDFLVIDSLINAGNTKQVGKRRLWILPATLAAALKEKIKQPHIITIAYSVNGGYTPLRYKYLGDEIAYCLAPRKFKRQFENNLRAAYYYNLFCSTKKRMYYQKAMRINPAYRVADNNYGPLYLSLRKLSLARKEFLRILKADPKNPAGIAGLGNIALEKKDFKKAKRYFSSALGYLKEQNSLLFKQIEQNLLFGLGRAEFHLKHFNKAKEYLARFQAKEPLHPYSYYLLGRIFEEEKDFCCAASHYKDAIRLGFSGIEPISRLLKISFHLKEKDDIIKSVITRYEGFKKSFIRAQNLRPKTGKKIKGISRVKKKMAILEKRLLSL